MYWPNCPGCDAGLAGSPIACPDCGLLLHGPAAAGHLAAVAALAQLEKRRAELLKRRDEALARMRAATAAAAAAAETVTAPAEASAAVAAGPVAAGGAGGAVSVRAPRRDLSHRAVQNLLLLLGGVLLSIAAVVFTLVSWQVPALRALILSVFTLAVLAAPWLLVRRRLVATAETVALIGLVLIPLDHVAITQVFDDRLPSAGPGLDPLWGYSLNSAALAVGWATYSRWAPLRLPAPVALVLAQAPLPLAGLAMDRHSSLWLAVALVATAALDLALWQAARRARAAIEYVTAAVAGSLAWVLGTGLVMILSVARSLDPLPVAPLVVSALVLAAASVVAMLWAAATRGQAARRLIATCACLAAMGAVCVVPWSLVPGSWQAAVFAGAACLILAATVKLPVRLRGGVRIGALLTLVAAAGWKAQAVTAAALTPLSWLGSVWDEAGGPASQVLGPRGIQWDDTAATPVVMVAVALGLALVPPWGEVWTTGLRHAVCLVFGSLAVLTAPVATGMPYEAALAVLVALTGALLLVAARATHETEGGTGAAVRAVTTRRAGDPAYPGRAALWLGGYLAVLAMGWALADRQATVGVAAGLLVVSLAGAVAVRPKAVQAAGGAGATLAAGLLVWGLFAGGFGAAFALLGVRAATLVVTRPSRKLAAAVVRARSTGATLALGSLDRITRLIKPGGCAAVETAAVAVGLFALAQHGVQGEWPALVLALCAMLAAASAWRRPRDPWRTAAAVEACLLAALAPLPVSKAVVPALVGPYGWLTHAWAGAAEGAREAVSPSGPWQEQPMLLPVLVLAAAAGTLAAWACWGRPAAMGVARIAFPLAATTLPVVADLPYWAALAFLVALTAGLALWSAVSRSAAGSASLWTATLAISWSLADRTATLAVLAAIVVTGLLCAIRGKGSPVTSVASTVTGLAIGAESVAAALGGGLGPENAALVLLLVAVLLARAAALPGLPVAVPGPVGGTAVVLWLVALALSVADPARLSLVLAVGALALAGTAGRLAVRHRAGAYVFAAVVSGVAVLPHLAVWAAVLWVPYPRIGDPWSEQFTGWPAQVAAYQWLGSQGEPFQLDRAGFVLSGVETALGVGAFVAVTSVIVARGLGGALAGRAAATVGAFWCLLLVPAVADMPYPGTSVFYGVLLVALATQAAAGARAGVAGVLAVGFGGHLVAWSLNAEPYTLLVLGGVAVLGIVTWVLGRDEIARTGAAASATVATGALAIASALSAGFRVQVAAFALLAVAALAALTAAALTRRKAPRLAAPGFAPTARTGSGTPPPRRPFKARTPAAAMVPAGISTVPSEIEQAQVGVEQKRADAEQAPAGAGPAGVDAEQAPTGADPAGVDAEQAPAGADPAGADADRRRHGVGHARGGTERDRRGGRVAVGVEVPGWCLAGVAVIMAATDAGLLSLALACAGVLALAVALRPDRRRAAWLGLGLLQLALWLRLAISDVTAPEAYTVPLSVAGLVAALPARRRDPGISSWVGYGTALALTFLPSAYAAWNDPGLARPLLLGVAAFAATLAGAWARLQAPLILGGAVLVVTAAHEFAPTLAELMGEGPRWLPIALAGAFLLFTGATYEHRLRDLRKIRKLIVRMR
ncbi:SCO7613 C-terminal domain-containing membrane protein [Nonomuraea sp. H19]|uniref:SCO7613 C-terminal domain-containing membrane protein n=1 Tax=Nonomuraea sp. H19 TaxID=3452206 RepID=UPI003F892C2C